MWVRLLLTFFFSLLCFCLVFGGFFASFAEFVTGNVGKASSHLLLVSAVQMCTHLPEQNSQWEQPLCSPTGQK